MNDAPMISLQDLYLNALRACCEDDHLTSVMQQTGEGIGRIWLMREGTTVPQAWIGFRFNADDVALKVVTRTERELAEVIPYAAGLDSFLPQLQAVLRAGMLADMSKGPARKIKAA